MLIADPIASLVGHLVSAGVELSSEGMDLVFNGPAAALTEEIMAVMQSRKLEILTLFRQNEARGIVKLGPTTWEQRRMEWRSRTDLNPAGYNVCIRVDLEGPVDLVRLDEITRYLVARHEIFRSRFAFYGKHLLQEIQVPPRSVLQVLDPATLFERDEQTVAYWCAHRGAFGFNLAAEAPVRCYYASRGGSRAVLLVTLHHIACDGWAIGCLQDEILALCREGDNDGSCDTFVEMTPTAFAQWEVAWLDDKRVESARAFWSQELKGAVLSPKLKCTSSGLEAGGNALLLRRSINPTTVAGVGAGARSMELSEFSIYFAAFSLVLSEQSGGQDNVVVIAVANRTHPEHEGVIGLTRNAQPIRCAVGVADCIDEVAQKLSACVQRALEFQYFPIGLIDTLAADATIDPKRLPITFGYSSESENCFRGPQITAAVHDVFLGAARAGFSLLVRRIGAEAEAIFEFSSSHMSPDDAGYMADQYIKTLTEAADRWTAKFTQKRH
ncbi:MAG: condensation domain-containing protein [Polynucleobacter sp.]|nr:condensation domain-containing protein [Polynucleobacter sp.]